MGDMEKIGIAQEPEWTTWPDERLLDLRLCDLHVKISGYAVSPKYQACCIKNYRIISWYSGHIFWLSDDWYSPDGIPGVAIPFYMGHPRLARLEQNQMLEVEGGTPEWCMRILRHEVGHAH